MHSDTDGVCSKARTLPRARPCSAIGIVIVGGYGAWGEAENYYPGLPRLPGIPHQVTLCALESHICFSA